MPYPTLLLIDDDITYCKTMQNEAMLEGFELLHRQSLEEGMELLREAPSILAIILDTRCHIDDDDTSSKAKTNFILHALKRIQDFEHEMNRSLPFCICTETPAEFSEDFEGIARVFDKNAPKEELFKHLKSCIKQLPQMRLHDMHSEIFNIFDMYFSFDEEELLTDLLLNIGKNDKASVISNLSLLRRLEESLVQLAAIKLLAKAAKTKEPRQQMGQTRVNLRILYSKGFIDTYHYSFADRMYQICSRYGNHISKENETQAFFPCAHTVHTLFYILADLCSTLSKRF